MNKIYSNSNKLLKHTKKYQKARYRTMMRS